MLHRPTPPPKLPQSPHPPASPRCPPPASPRRGMTSLYQWMVSLRRGMALPAEERCCSASNPAPTALNRLTPSASQDGVPPLMDGVASPRKCVGPLMDGVAPLREGIGSPMDGAVSPLDGVAPPRNGVAPPRKGVVPPMDGVDPPMNGIAPPKRGAAPPMNGVTPPMDGIAPPRKGVVPLRKSAAPLNTDGPATHPSPLSSPLLLPHRSSPRYVAPLMHDVSCENRIVMYAPLLSIHTCPSPCFDPRLSPPCTTGPLLCRPHTPRFKKALCSFERHSAHRVLSAFAKNSAVEKAAVTRAKCLTSRPWEQHDPRASMLS